MSTSIAVVVATYNRGPYIAAALDSILAQTRAPDRVVIVDDGSTDETPRILQTFLGRGVEVIRQDNRERGAARNRGVAAVDCDLVAFLDSDDRWDPGHLEGLERALHRRTPRPLVGAFAGAVLRAAGSEEVVGRFIGPDVVGERELLDRNEIPLSGSLVRRERLLEVGGFIEERDLQMTEDWDLWLRCTADGGAFVRADAPTVTLLVHPGNSTGDGDRLAETLLRQRGNVVERLRDRPAARARAAAGWTRAAVRARIGAGDRVGAVRDLAAVARDEPAVLTTPGYWRSLPWLVGRRGPV